MILGFAHITKNVPSVHGGWLIVNAPEKWPLMERRSAWHSLLVKSDRRLPEEVVEYDTGVVDQHLNRLDVEGDRILLAARDPRVEIDFFVRGLGLENLGDWVGISNPSRIRQWNAQIQVVGDGVAPLDPPLDVAGYAVLAFYSSNVEADRDRALAAGGRAPTEPFTVKLDRDMKIVMLRSPEGTIIELIQVMR